MLEWLKRHAWKACKRQKRFPSSNLGRSAAKALKDNRLNAVFQRFFLPKILARGSKKSPKMTIFAD